MASISEVRPQPSGPGVRARLPRSSLHALTPGVAAIGSQGKKLPTNWTFGKKTWNHGAPNSKKSTGVGRGCRPKPEGNDENSDQLRTVPLPADRNEVTVPCTRNFLVDPPAAATSGQEDTENAAGLPQPPIRPINELPPIPVRLAAMADEDP